MQWNTLHSLMSIVLNVHPGVQLHGHPGGQQKKFLPFGHGNGLAAFKGTDLQNKSFQDQAEISKAYILSVLVKWPVLADLSITLQPIRMERNGSVR